MLRTISVAVRFIALPFIAGFYTLGAWTPAYASIDINSPDELISAEAHVVQMPPVVTGELKRWHPITVTIDGPQTSESGNPHPFWDYRFEVIFSQAELSITVPGYFAADGNAAESGANSGNKWRVHFIPPRTGSWTFRTSFRQGTDVAINTDPNAGSPVSPYDNQFGSFSISETDKSGPDFRAKGKLRYVGEHYLKFDNGSYYIKGGADSPENLLAFEDFDQTYNNGGVNFIKSYSNHVSDWKAGDPTWKGGKGKGLIGALNYLASKGMNSVYFITMNINGDGNDVWPWTSPGERSRYDVSKLDQWNIVFDHMDRLGIMLHVLTQETENELLLDGGNLGRHRKLYYRELIARFGYHHAITWNLGEENDNNTTSQRKQFSDYISALDPYDHPVVIHTYPGQWGSVYGPLLNHPTFDGTSLQVGKPEDTHGVTLDWINQSAQSSKKWYVCMDEAGPWESGVTPDGPGNNHDLVRKEVLWGNLMAGGCGVEWYFGYSYPNTDLNAEDWTTRENVWNFTRHAVTFFQNHLPFTQMKSNDGLTSSGNDYVFAKEGEVYAVYLKNGGSTNLNITGGSKSYTIQWYNPREGGALVNGTVAQVNGPGNVGIGQPPSQTSQDWVALIKSGGTSSPLYGDASEDGNVNSYDASLVLQHSSGIITLQSAAQTLADVSGNGSITALDASLILQRVVNLITCFPAESGCPGKTSANSSKSEIRWSNWSKSAHGASITLQLTKGLERAQGIDLDIHFDAEALSFDRLDYILPDGWQAIEQAEEGRIKLAVAGLPASAGGDLITLHFNRLSDAGPTSTLTASVSIDESPAVSATTDAAGANPTTFALESNYPNPFNPSTTIAYSLPQEAQVKLEVFDVSGRSVAVLVNEFQTVGHYTASFDAADLPSGLYLYRIEAGDFVKTRKMTLVK